MKWEYKTFKFAAKGLFLGGKVDEREIDVVLNELGADGWELACSFDTNQDGGSTKDIVILFKRHASSVMRCPRQFMSKSSKGSIWLST